MLDFLSILTPLITSSLPSTTPTTPTRHHATGLPIAHTSTVYRLTPARHFCRVLCPFCGRTHSHGVDLLELNPENGFGPRKAHCTRLDRGDGGDYWIALDAWAERGGRVEDGANVAMAEGGTLIWL
jgi:hypothetical protein